MKKKKTAPLLVIYKPIRGDYSQSGAVMDEIFYFLKNEMKIKTTKGFGIYFDKPGSVKTGNLRCVAGSVLNNNEKIDELKLKSRGFKTGTVEGNNAYFTTFPYKSKISVIFSLFKVYPAIAKKLKSEGLESLPVMEIYNIPEKRIEYTIFKKYSTEEMVRMYY